MWFLCNDCSLCQLPVNLSSMIENKDMLAPWLALHRINGLGPIGYQKLLQKFGSPQDVFDGDQETLKQCGMREPVIKHIKQPDWKQVEADMLWLDKSGCHLVTYYDSRYPALLKEIADPPMVLFVKGNIEALHTVQLGMIGTRNPDNGGKKTAIEFARGLAQSKISVTSGLALGIDSYSHQGALEGGGPTIAVTGSGLDMVYPARHRQLAEKISDNGALVSEFPPGTEPIPANFPRRNRIISGLSVGIMVIQAALRSGSLITAQHAAEQGREIFAVPGSIHNPLAKGCHALIKQGAKLVESIQDILEELKPLATVVLEKNISQESRTDQIDIGEDYKKLLQSMAYDPVSIDQLIEITGLTADTVSSMLLVLEVRGLVASQPGGIYMQIN